MNIILIWSSYFLLLFTILDSMVLDHSFFLQFFLVKNYHSHLLSLPVIATLRIPILCHSLTIISFCPGHCLQYHDSSYPLSPESINSNTFTASILNFMISYHNYSLESFVPLSIILWLCLLSTSSMKLNVERKKIAITMTSLIFHTWLQTAMLQGNITHIANLLYHSLKWLCTTSFLQ